MFRLRAFLKSDLSHPSPSLTLSLVTKSVATLEYRNNWLSVLLLCRSWASVDAGHHHQQLRRWARYSTPCILFVFLADTAPCLPGFLFLTGTTSYLFGPLFLSDLHPVFLASWQTFYPVCLIVYSWQQRILFAWFYILGRQWLMLFARKWLCVIN